MRYWLVLVAAFAFSASGCEKPAPPTTVVPTVATPPDREVHIDAGRPAGVDVNVDVEPGPGGPDIKVDVDRPAQP